MSAIRMSIVRARTTSVPERAPYQRPTMHRIGAHSGTGNPHTRKAANRSHTRGNKYQAPGNSPHKMKQAKRTKKVNKR